MSTTYLRAVASLDGYTADERDDVRPLHDWYSTATIRSSTRANPTFTVRHSGSQRPPLTTCVACGHARKSWPSDGTSFLTPRNAAASQLNGCCEKNAQISDAAGTCDCGPTTRVKRPGNGGPPGQV